jgi:hypothetical protein
MKGDTASHTAPARCWRPDDPEGQRRARLAAGLLVARAAADYPERIVPPPPAPADSSPESTPQPAPASTPAQAALSVLPDYPMVLHRGGYPDGT